MYDDARRLLKCELELSSAMSYTGTADARTYFHVHSNIFQVQNRTRKV